MKIDIKKIYSLISVLDRAFDAAREDPRDHNLHALLEASSAIRQAQPGSDVSQMLSGLERETRGVFSLTSTLGRMNRLKDKVHYYATRLAAAHHNDYRGQEEA